MLIIFKNIASIKFTFLFLLIINSTLLYSQETNKDVKSKRYRFIYSVDLFFNTKTEDAIALTKVFTEKIKKQKGIENEVEIVVCNNITELFEATKTNFDFVLSTTVDLVKLMKNGNVRPVLVNQTQGSYGYVYYLITRKDRKLNNLSDLKDCKIKILARADGLTPSLWLEKLLRDNRLPHKEKLFKEISFDYKPTNIVLPVFFKKLDVAIVTKASFDLLCELNPNILNEINILEISNTLLFGVLSFDKRNKDKEREQFVYDILTTMQNDIDGKQFLNLFNLDKIIPYREEYLTKFMELYK